MTDIQDLKDVAKKITDAKAEARALIKEHGHAAIGSAFQAVLKYCPSVAVYWTQDVPSFNDGDPCRFRVHDMWIVPSDERPSGRGEDESIDTSDAELMAELEVTSDQIEALYAVWHQLDSWILEETFGENASVFITADEIQVDDCDCGY